jgi:hypothetical protein
VPRRAGRARVPSVVMNVPGCTNRPCGVTIAGKRSSPCRIEGSVSLLYCHCTETPDGMKGLGEGGEGAGACDAEGAPGAGPEIPEGTRAA